MIDCADCINNNGLPSACCHDVTVKIDTPTDLDGWGEMRWMAAHEKVSVAKENGSEQWVVVFETPCSKLTNKGTCSIYNERPKICADYSQKTCIINGEGDLYEHYLSSIEEVDEYIRKEVLEDLKRNIEEEVFETKKYFKDMLATREQIIKWPHKPKST